MQAVPRNSMRAWIVKLSGSLLLLTGVLLWVPFDELRAGLARISLAHFLLVLTAFSIGHVLAAAKWWWLMRAPFDFRYAVRAHFAGLAANLCLPSVAGGDVVRAGLAYRAWPSGGAITAASTTDRVIDLVALAAIAIVGALVSSADPRTALVVLLIVFALGAALIWLLPALLNKLSDLFPGLPLRKLSLSLSEAFGDIGRSPARLLLLWCFSVAIQVLFVFLAFSLARSAGLQIGFAIWAFAWALAKLVAVLPISINGLGLREASLAAILAPFGAPSGLVVAAGLAWQLVLFSTGILGAVVLALTPSGPPKDNRERSGADPC